MTTQYTTILKLALPVQGELSGTWGDVVNDNITSMVEEAVAGRKVIDTWTANSHTLTSADGTTSESRAAILTLTDTGTALTGAGTVVCPALSKIYIVENSTAQVITIKTSGGTGIAVPVGRNMVVFCDGTNVEEGISNIASLSIGGDGATVTGIKDEDDMSSDSATKLATQQSIKAYVDSQVGANNELSEVLANGNTTGGTDISVSSGDDITFADSSKAIFGAGSDLQIYHDGSNSYIEDAAGTGNLKLRTNTLRIENAAGTELSALFVQDGAATLYNDNTARLATTSTGIDVTGNVTLESSDAGAGEGPEIFLYRNSASPAASDVLGVINFDGENSAGSQHTYGKIKGVIVDPTNTSEDGKLVFQARGAGAGFSDIMTVASTGIDVTGTVTADGLALDGSNGKIYLPQTPSAFNWLGDSIEQTGILIDPTNDGSSETIGLYTNNAKRLDIDSGGDISFYEDTGTTPKFFWDASAETLAIGVSAANARLEVGAFATTSSDIAYFSNSNGSHKGIIRLDAQGDGEFVLRDAGNNEDVVITAGGDSYFNGGNVGIGCTPSRNLDIQGTGDTLVSIVSPAANQAALFFGDTDSDSVGRVAYDNSDNSMRLTTNGSEAMRIDSSGNVGINNSNPSSYGKFVVDGTGNILNVNATSGSALLQLYEGGSGRFGIQTLDGSAGAKFTTAGTERMRIDSSGKVGIGASSVNGKLDIKTSNAGFEFYPENSTDTNLIINYDRSASSYQNLQTRAATHQFLIDASEAMRIDSSGRVGIGTSSPAVLLDIAEGTAATDAIIGLTAGTGGRAQIRSEAQADNTSSELSFYTMVSSATNERMRIDSSGNVNIYGTDNRPLAITSFATASAGAGWDLDATSGNGVVTVSTGGTERIRIDSSGNVGIGTSSPSVQLHLQDGASEDVSGSTIRMDLSGNNPYWEIQARNGGNSANRKLHFYTNSGSDEVLTLTQAGQVGIGTSSPTYTLSVNSGSSTVPASLESTGTDSWLMLKDTNTTLGNVRLGSSSNSLIAFAGGSERMRIDSSGNLLIGATSGTGKLEVYEAANLTEGDPHFRIHGAGYSGFHFLDGSAYYIGQNSAGRALRLYSGAETSGVNLASGGTSWGTFSDERLKYDVEPIENALESLSELRTVKYRLRNVDESDSQKKLGVIAQDLVGVIDEVIDPLKITGDETEYMAVRYTELVPVLIKAIQEQQATITALTARIEQLENN